MSGAWGVEELQLRNEAVEYARSLVGLGWNFANREQYADVLFPFDSPAQRRQLAAACSSCTLKQEAVLRHLGLDEDYRFRIPYGKRCTKGGVLYAGALLKSVALASGAWVDAVRWDGNRAGLFQPGDMPIIGVNHGGPRWGRGPASDFEHGLTVCEINGDEVVSVDGGQPHIAEVKRKIVEVGSELWLASPDSGLDPDGRPSKGRRVTGWANLWLLPRRSIVDGNRVPDV
jgi:hypothetical protein